MKVSRASPPNIEEMRLAFPLCESKQAVFIFGTTIYNPFNADLTLDVVEHERVHAEQQAREPSVAIWYFKYINDVAFRMECEVEAYRAQFAYVSRRIKDRETVSWYTDKLAESLSSPLYGLGLTRAEARALIRKT